MDDLERQRQLRRERDRLLDTPNCPRCLHRMEAVTSEFGDVWRCPECGETLDSA